MGHSARDFRHFGFVVFKNVVRTEGKLRLNSNDFRQYCIILRGRVKSRFQFREDLLSFTGDGRVIERDSKPAQTLIGRREDL